MGQLIHHLVRAEGDKQIGKALALSRTVQLATTALTPLITGYYIDSSESTVLYAVCVGITLLAVGIVQKSKHVFNANNMLPNVMHLD